MKKIKLLKPYRHAVYGESIPIESYSEHPVSGVPGEWYKIMAGNDCYYVERKELK